MAYLIERILIKVLKLLKVDLLTHAHVQIGAGHSPDLTGDGEEYVIKYLIERILARRPDVLFDVGANSGDYAKILSETFPSSQIYCFEPMPDNFKKLTKQTAGLNTINILSALGSHEGTLKLHLGEHNSNGTMATAHKGTLETIFPFVGKIDEFESPMTTLDKFCSNTISQIDFLKIDVEGSELDVLKGAANLIKSDRIKIIQFEFNEFNIFSKTFMYDFYELLKQYRFYRILPQNKLLPLGEYNSSLEIFRYQNILALHKSLNYE